jgi:thioredoxin-like negative regulator of GroEL
MEFEQYLERDIITFLDSKMQRKDRTAIDREEEYGLYLTKDYLKELSYALDNDELTKAKKLFDELKSNYSKLPRSSVERKKIYSLLERMYEKIQNYVRIKEGRIEVIKQGDSEIFKDRTDKFTETADISGKAQEDKIDTEQLRIEIKRTSLPISLEEKPLKTIEDNKTDIPTASTAESLEDMNISIPAPEAPVSMIDAPKEKETKATVPPTPPTVVNAMEDKTKAEPVEEVHKKREKHKKPYEKNEEIPEKVLLKGGESESVRQKGLEEIKDEIINTTAGHLEKLKTHVTGKLLDELNKKIEEKSDEHSNSIDLLRKEIIKEMIKELNRRFKVERRETDRKMETLRSDILQQVYDHTGQTISANNNQPNIAGESHINAADEEKTSDEKDSNKKLNVVYEQAVYYMFDNKYDEAARLFRSILESHPNNKAARIRLQECIEKHPETSEENKSIENMNSNITETGPIISDPEQIQTFAEPILNLDDGVTEFKSELNNTINENIQNIQRVSYAAEEEDQNEEMPQTQKHGNKSGEEKLQKMYEEAIYTMFQNKYGEAARVFKEILKINPENRAARIRLQECLEKQAPDEKIENVYTSRTEPEAEPMPNSEQISASAESKQDSDDIMESKPADTTNGDVQKISYATTEDQDEISKVTKIRRRRSEEELQKMYEEAIYTMYQNDYESAAKIFTEILRIKPENKAARIRLQECIEAINNA